MDSFDITCTATLRPELLDVTLSSHVKYLFRQCIEKAHLIINIDFAGVEDYLIGDKKLEDILRIIDCYPFANVTMRIGKPPHFPTAFMWCMEQTRQQWVFHLEEDWRLTMPIDFEKMMEVMYVNKRLAHLRLSAFQSTDRMKCWNKFIDWNGDYFQVPADLKPVIGWAGHPSLNRRSFIKEVMPFVDVRANPEKQIKGRRYKHPLNGIFAYYEFGVFHKRNTPKAEEDIGRKWMVDNRYIKAGNKAWFTNWERAT